MDWKKLALAGMAGGVVVGAAATSLAVSGTHTPSAAPKPGSGSSAASPAPVPHRHGMFGRPGGPFGHHPGGPDKPGRGPDDGPFAALHGTWVTGDGAGHYTTHDQIRGAVTRVSTTALTVRAEDGFIATYAITGTTVVLVRPQDTPDPQDDPVPAPSGSTAPAPSESPARPGAGRPPWPMHPGHRPTTAKISDVHTGDQVEVVGTGTSALSADTVLKAS